MAAVAQYCTFYVHGQNFGLDVRKVLEIACAQEITRVPLAPPVVRGLINMRGRIVTVLDLRRRLALPERASDHDAVHVIVDTDDGAVSLLADSVGDVVRVKESTFERPPETLPDAARDLIRGAYKLTDRLLMILDLDKIVASENGATTTPGHPLMKHPSQDAGLLEYTS